MGVVATADLGPGALVACDVQALVRVPGVEGIRRAVAVDHSRLSDSLCSDEMRELNALCASDVRLVRACAMALSTLTPDDMAAFLSLRDAYEPGQAGTLRRGQWVQMPAHGGGSEGVVIANKGAIVVVEIRDPERGREFIDVAVEYVSVVSHRSIGGILMTNGVSSETEDVTEVYGTFSRVNHSCLPNARAVTHEGSRAVFTSRAVVAGEEICISYLDEDRFPSVEQLQAVATRVGTSPDLLHAAFYRQQVFSKWGFWCACSRCGPLEGRADGALAAWLSHAAPVAT